MSEIKILNMDVIDGLTEDTKAGLRRATEEGRPPGRPRVEVDWNRLEAWRAKGLSYRTAAIVEGYSQSTLRRRMKERTITKPGDPQ